VVPDMQRRRPEERAAVSVRQQSAMLPPWDELQQRGRFSHVYSLLLDSEDGS
jgi:hypothetical protein